MVENARDVLGVVPFLWMACHCPRDVRPARRAVDILYSVSGGSSVYFYIPIQRVFQDVHAIRKHALMNLEKNIELHGASYPSRTRELSESSRMKQFMASSQTPAAEAADIASSTRKIIASRACHVPRRRLRRPHHAGRPPGHGESAVAEDQAIRASWVVVERDGRWWTAAYENSPAYRPLPVSRS
ncbi:hypothetical protein [Amycolatopsis mediterranei]|nr:hypothetical protein [Amycolatopsis mediterranei]UZF74083.1 hypothetical protein ISP_007571 [Amycolatopsis mediterranei]